MPINFMDLTGSLAGRIGDMFGYAQAQPEQSAYAPTQQVQSAYAPTSQQTAYTYAPPKTDPWQWMAQNGVQSLYPSIFAPPQTMPTPQPGPNPSPGIRTTSYTPGGGMTPGVAKWATQTHQVFGDIQGLDPDTMLAIMTNESGGDPNAYNSAGDAWGLFQNVGLHSTDPNAQFAAAHQLAQQKMAAINASYAQNGLNPDARTRARDFALAWAGHFDYASGGPNPNSRDVGSGQTADQLSNIFLGNYDRIKAGAAQATAVGNGSGGAAVNKAMAYVGAPYVSGGLRNHPNDPSQGLDCSELTGLALGLPQNLWNAQAQYDHSQRLTADQLQPGDLVFFQGTDPSNNQPITHVGLYIGGGKMVNSQDGGVMVADLNNSYWQQHLAGYGRMAGQQATTY